MTAGEESPTLARFTETKFLKLDDRYDGEAVVQFSHVDITWLHARHFVCDTARLRRTKLGQTWGAHQMLVRVVLPNPLQIDRLALKVCSPLCRGDNKGTARVGSQTAVQHAN